MPRENGVDSGRQVLNQFREAATFSGQVQDGVYFSSNRFGSEVTLVGWNAANADVAEDQATQCVVLSHKPLVRGRENQTILKLKGDGEGATYVFSGPEVFRQEKIGQNGHSQYELRPIELGDAVRVSVALRAIRHASPNARLLPQ